MTAAKAVRRSTSVRAAARITGGASEARTSLTRRFTEWAGPREGYATCFQAAPSHSQVSSKADHDVAWPF